MTWKMLSKVFDHFVWATGFAMVANSFSQCDRDQFLLGFSMILALLFSKLIEEMMVCSRRFRATRLQMLEVADQLERLEFFETACFITALAIGHPKRARSHLNRIEAVLNDTGPK